VIGDQVGNVITTANPGGPGSAWRGELVAPGGLITGVSCASRRLCVASGFGGDVIWSTDPLGGRRAWHHQSLNHGVELNLNGVSCPSVRFCTIVGEHGTAFTSSNPSGGAGAWKRAVIDHAHDQIFGGNAELQGVSCTSAHLCVAVDDAGGVVTSTNPAGGGRAWRRALVDVVPGPHGGGGLVYAVSCPSAHLCVAGDGRGEVLTSTDPTGGPAAWHIGGQIGQKTSLHALSCPTTTMCVAINESEEALVSVDPTGGPSAWSATPLAPLAPGTYYPTGLACASARLCLVVAPDQRLFVGR
jgi:hypothetical protein